MQIIVAGMIYGDFRGSVGLFCVGCVCALVGGAIRTASIGRNCILHFDWEYV